MSRPNVEKTAADNRILRVVTLFRDQLVRAPNCEIFEGGGGRRDVVLANDPWMCGQQTIFNQKVISSSCLASLASAAWYDADFIKRQPILL